MIPFGYPNNLAEAIPLLQGGVLAILLMLPVVMGDGSYSGIFPRGHGAVIHAIVRAVAVIALVYPIAGRMVRAPLVELIGIAAGVLLLVMSQAINAERTFCRTCGWISILPWLCLAVLTPASSYN